MFSFLKKICGIETEKSPREFKIDKSIRNKDRQTLIFLYDSDDSRMLCLNDAREIYIDDRHGYAVKYLYSDDSRFTKYSDYVDAVTKRDLYKRGCTKEQAALFLKNLIQDIEQLDKSKAIHIVDLKAIRTKTNREANKISKEYYRLFSEMVKKEAGE